MSIVWSSVGVALGLSLNALVAQWPVGTRPPIQKLPGWLLPGMAGLILPIVVVVADDPTRLATMAAFAGGLLLLAALDVTYRLVPNVIVFPMLIAAIWFGPVGTPISAVAGALSGLVFFGALYWLGRWLYGRPALGMGDVKLAMLLGAVVGFSGLWVAMLLAMLLAGLVAAGLVLGRRIDRQATLPYGSFMALSGLIVLILAARN